jgi:hypothetical protein
MLFASMPVKYLFQPVMDDNLFLNSHKVVLIMRKIFLQRIALACYTNY